MHQMVKSFNAFGDLRQSTHQSKSKVEGNLVINIKPKAFGGI